MNHIIINNYDSHLAIRATDTSNTIDHIPAMVYKAGIMDDRIVMIKDRPTFRLPALRFGRHKTYVKQITSAYDRDGSAVGVLAAGHKGSGKSLLAEELGNWMITQDIPVIMVTIPMSAEELKVILTAVGPCMVYFDEIGKVYEEKRRAQLLPLFSDTSLTGVMFVITGNSSEEFSEYLINRPQRFRYAINFSGGFDTETMDDILQTMKVEPALHVGFHAYAREHGRSLNYDSLLCVIRESAGCKNTDEVVSKTSILNVPSFPVCKWNVDSVVVSGVKDGYSGYGYKVELDANVTGVKITVLEKRKDYRESSGLSWANTLIEDPNKLIKFYHVDNETLARGPVEVVHDGYRSLRIKLTYGFAKEALNAYLEPTDDIPDEDIAAVKEKPTHSQGTLSRFSAG